MVARARPTAARSTTRAALTRPSPVLVAQVAEDPRPQEHQRQPALSRREHDLLARVALRLAQDVIEPALEGHHVLGPARGRPHARPGEITGEPAALAGQGRAGEGVGAGRRLHELSLAREVA